MTMVQSAQRSGNRFDRMEWAGAFGDLGTLIPFTLAYVTLLKVDPLGILFAFGVAMIAAGCHYRTPFPVQPMKVVGPWQPPEPHSRSSSRRTPCTTPAS